LYYHRGYACTNRNGNTCIATATTSTDILTAQCSGTKLANIGLKALPDVATLSAKQDGSVLTSIFTRTVTVLAPMFQINFQSTDLLNLETSSGSVATTPLPTSVQSDATSSSTGTDAGLSVGAKAGIGVGIGAAALLLLLFAWVFYRKRQQARISPPESTEAAVAPQYYYYAEPKPQEPPRELETPRYHHEAVELPTTPHNHY